MEGMKMTNIILDDQFQYLLPELDEKTYQNLEASILEYGILLPLVLWNGILIDGYNRYMIAVEHGIPFFTVDMEFNSREDAEIWIIENQISRRNLNPMQLSYFRGLHYKADKKSHGDINRTVENPLNNASLQNANLQTGSTAKRLADKYKISRDTIIRDEKLADTLLKIGEISPDAKRKILSGEVHVNKSKLEDLSSAPLERLEAVVAEIEEGTYNRRAAVTARRDEINNIMGAFPEVQKLNTIINNFAKDINSLIQEVKTGNPAEIKSTLRSYIDELEELYNII